MSRRPNLPGRLGFTLVELLVVIAVIGILSGLLLPAVQAAREAARLTQCRNHLHQISLATELFHQTHGAYPPGRYQPRPGESAPVNCGGNETTWLVRILPYLEHKQLEEQWEYSQPYANHADEVREATLAFYCCPTRRSRDEATGTGILAGTATSFITMPCGCSVAVTGAGTVLKSGAVGDYGGNLGDLSPGAYGLPTDFFQGGNGTGVIISSRARCRDDLPVTWIDRIGHKSVIDGLSSTLMVGEMHVPLHKTGQSPQDAFIFNGDQAFNFSRVGGPTVPIVSNLKSEGNGLVSWGSWHRGGCNFALCDGSVKTFSPAMDTELLGRLGNRQDGEVAELDPR